MECDVALAELNLTCLESRLVSTDNIPERFPITFSTSKKIRLKIFVHIWILMRMKHNLFLNDEKTSQEMQYSNDLNYTLNDIDIEIIFEHLS